jgi:hypothetical protein
MTEPRQRQAALEIQAWTVTGTPLLEAKAALLEAYRTKCPCEKDAFIAALIDLALERAFSISQNASLPA